MPRQSKQKRHLQAARIAREKAAKDLEIERLVQSLHDESEAGIWQPETEHEQWRSQYQEEFGSSESDTEEELQLTDDDSEEENDLEETELSSNAFTLLMAERMANKSQVQPTHFLYQRGFKVNRRTEFRKRQKAKDLQNAAQSCKKIADMWNSYNPGSANSNESQADSVLDLTEARALALKDLEDKVKSKKHALRGQTLVRHQAVLQFLKIQTSRKSDETREFLSLMVARCYKKNVYFSRRLIVWERSWCQWRSIEESKRGCFSKVKSWFGDEGVQLAVREWISKSGERIRFFC